MVCFLAESAHAQRGRRWCVVIILGIALSLTACTAPLEAGTVTIPRPIVSPNGSDAPVVSQPALVPDGTAEENLPFFTLITAQVWGSDQQLSSRAYIEALTVAGFPREAMQVTDDTTTVGNPAESIQFSVRWTDGNCLVGQVGPSTGEPVTTIMDQLADGRCLIGSTLPIDW